MGEQLSGDASSKCESHDEAGVGGVALLAYQVPDHPHGHKAGKRVGVRRRSSHQEDRRRGDAAPEVGDQTARFRYEHCAKRAEEGGPIGEDVKVEEEEVEEEREEKPGFDGGGDAARDGDGAEDRGGEDFERRIRGWTRERGGREGAGQLNKGGEGGGGGGEGCW